MTDTDLVITTNEDEQRQLTVTVEVPEARVQRQMRQTARKLSRDLRIPGFRRGKAPYNVIVGLVGGEQALRQDTVNDMLDDLYREVMSNLTDVVPFAQPTLDDIAFAPTVLSLTIPLEPIVELGDYRALQKSIEPPAVSADAVDEALAAIQEQHATVEPVDRPIELEDVVTIAGTGTIGEGDEADEIFNEESLEITVAPDAVFRGTNFAEFLLGVSTGDTIEFTLDFPDDHEVEGWRGKSADFVIDILDVKERHVPPLDDELAKLDGEHETLDELRAATETELREQAETQFKNDVRDEWVRDLIDGVEAMVYPPGAVEAEIDSMLDRMKQQYQMMGIEWEQFLQITGRQEEDMRLDMEDDAVESLERTLVLRAFIQSEQLEVTDEEMAAGVDKFLDGQAEMEEFDDEGRASLREYFQGPGGDYIRNQIILEKVDERILAIRAGTAPELADVTAEEPDADEEPAEDAAGEQEVESATAEVDAPQTAAPDDEAAAQGDADDGGNA